MAFFFFFFFLLIQPIRIAVCTMIPPCWCLRLHGTWSRCVSYRRSTGLCCHKSSQKPTNPGQTPGCLADYHITLASLSHLNARPPYVQWPMVSSNTPASTQHNSTRIRPYSVMQSPRRPFQPPVSGAQNTDHRLNPPPAQPLHPLKRQSITPASRVIT